jgi:hypothetical protein
MQMISLYIHLDTTFHNPRVHIFHENHPPLLFLSAFAFAAICASSSLIFLIVASRLYSITRFSLKYLICGVSRQSCFTPSSRNEEIDDLVFISAPVLYIPNSLHNPFHILHFLLGISVGPQRHALRRLIYCACLSIRRRDLWIRNTILGHSDRARHNHRLWTFVALMSVVRVWRSRSTSLGARRPCFVGQL